MGMYTELIFGAKFKIDTPIEIINTIRFLADDLKEEPQNYQWIHDRNPLLGGSYYFGISSPVTKIWNDGRGWILSSRANIKNYEGEIEAFLSMVKPWIEEGSGISDIYAIVIYEERTDPILYKIDYES